MEMLRGKIIERSRQASERKEVWTPEDHEALACELQDIAMAAAQIIADAQELDREPREAL
jgi:hypothetical protein